MTTKDFCLFLYSLFHLSGIICGGVHGTRCSDCSGVADITQCTNTTQCADGASCFIERFGYVPYAQFNLGCLSNKICPSQPSQPFRLVGRDLRVPVPNCRQCCQTDDCNSRLCDFQASAPAPVSTTTLPCDDKNNNCVQLNGTLNVCNDIHSAKTICRKYCKLCDLVDGNWNVWSSWSDCSVSCGVGDVARQRTCSNPAPANGGLGCSGNSTQTKSCSRRDCPVHGGWSIWSQWGACSTGCGLGLTKRRRTCTNPTPSIDGHYCFGEALESDLCNGTDCTPKMVTPNPPPTLCTDTVDSCSVINETLGVCADINKARAICRKYCRLCGVVDGFWSDWSAWTTCSVSCGNGTSSRLRACDNPAPTNGGLQCPGLARQIRDCNEHDCPVHGGWSIWTGWSECSSTCGTGLTNRRRSCDNPRPSLFGSNCHGDPVEYSLCEIQSCAVDGGWASWSSWSSCPVTCGIGMSERTRSCTSPSPSGSGLQCLGDKTENKLCHLRDCSVDGGWSSWYSWSSCPVTCGTGMSHRTRYCSNPSPVGSGRQCLGDTKENRICHLRDCSVNGGWSSWYSWSSCSVTCGTGMSQRTRSCTNPSPTGTGRQCVGEVTKYKLCNSDPCSSNGRWTSWSSWSTLNTVMSHKICNRVRTCIGQFHGGQKCPGSATESKTISSGLHC